MHRDIKPANVLFDERGEPCLADFGVALSRDQTHGLTVAGMVVGTPGFMAPEQARGEPVSPATDVFSLGATLLFAATGEGPTGRATRACSWSGRPAARSTGSQAAAGVAAPPAAGHARPTAGAAAQRRRPRRRPPGTARHGVRAGPGRRRAWALLGGGVAVLALVVGGGAWPGGGKTATATAGDGTPAEADCVDLPYQPCGERSRRPAPTARGASTTTATTTGTRPTAARRCPTTRTASRSTTRSSANIVPADDVDTYPMEVEDHLQLLCDGQVTITLERPPGMTLRSR